MLSTRRRQNPAKDAELYIRLKKDNSAIAEKFIDCTKGRGVFANAHFAKNAFIVEYRGQLCQLKILNKSANMEYVYTFKYNSTDYCIDASAEDGSLGRLCNDSKYPNCKAKIVTYEGEPHLCLFALKDINLGEEITYDYGVEDLPWRVDAKKPEPDNSDTQGEAMAMVGAEEPEPDNSDTQGEAMAMVGAECATHEVSYKVLSIEKCKICCSPIVSQRWLGVQCKVCHGVWHDKCLKRSSEDWNLPDTDGSSGDEYIPDSSEEEEESESEDEEFEIIKLSSGINSVQPEKEKNTSPMSEETELMTCAEIENQDETVTGRKEKNTSVMSEEIEIESQTNSESSDVTGKKLKSDVNYCFVCQQPQTKISRHFETHAKENADIARALSFPKSSKERKMQLEKLRNTGNFQHNSKVLGGSGNLKVKRRSSKKKLNYDFCLHCKGMFVKKELWRHMKRCFLKPENSEVPYEGRQRVANVAASQRHLSQPVSDGVWTLLGKMHNDEVSVAVRNDHFSIQLAQSLFNKYGHDKKRHEYIRQKLRELGRLLIVLRQSAQIHNLEEAIEPCNFMKVTEAVKKVAGFDPKNNSYKAPSLALKIGHSLRRVSDLILCSALMAENQDRINSIGRFQTLYETKWSECVSHSALAHLSHAKYNKSSTLPLATDIQKLHAYLAEQLQTAITQLKDQPHAASYAAVARLSLCQITLFNRRRAGEVSKMTLKNFTDRIISELHDDVSLGLSEVEKKLCKLLCRVELEGKRGRKVAIILTPNMIAALSQLVDKRGECGVTDDNLYLFAIPHRESCYRGTDCFKTFANMCGAQNPKLLTSTNLRKHIATISQVLNLKENELDQLADFLGHNIRVHREYYRLPHSTTQVAKLSKLLMAMEKGSAGSLQGKSLDQIDDQLELSEGDSSTADEDDMDCSTADEGASGDLRSVSLGAACHGNDDEDQGSCSAGSVSCGDNGANLVPVSASSSGNNGLMTRRKPYTKKPWTKAEILAVEKHFSTHIMEGKLATLQECEHCGKSEYPILQNRTLQNIRDFVRNRGKKAKKN